MTKKILLLSFILISFLGFSQNIGSLNINVKNYSQPYNICKADPVILEVSPKIDSLQYQWYKNGEIFILGPGSITLSEGGIYTVSTLFDRVMLKSNTVQIENCRPEIPKIANSNNSTLTVNPTITSVNPVICGSNTSAILQANPVNAAYTYQWYFSTSEYGSYTVLAGATSATYTTTIIGFYKVLIGDENPPVLSQAFSVSDKPQATLSDINGNVYADVYLLNGSAELKVTLVGGAPYYFSLNDGAISKSYTANSNSISVSVSPNQNKGYFISSLSNSCGIGRSRGFNKVVVDPLTNFTLPTPSNLNICAGGTFSIPYNTTGTWLNERNMNVNIINAVNNNYVNGGQYNFSQNPIQFQIPADLPLNGTYKLEVSGRIPYTNNVLSSYILTVNAIGCMPTSASILGNNVGCGTVYLNSNIFNYVEPYTYQWYKNGVLIPNATSQGYYSTESGSYTLNIQKVASSYNITTPALQVIINGQTPVISTPNKTICGNSTSTILSSTINSNSFSYQWLSYNSSDGSQIPILGATNPTYAATAVGNYLLQITDSQCSNTSNIISISNFATSKITDINDVSDVISVNSGQSTTLKVSLGGAGPWNFSLYDGTSFTYHTTSTSPYLIAIYPNQSRNYSIYDLSNECGLANSYSSIKVNVTPLATISLPTPSVTTVCNNSVLDIPYTTGGIWQDQRQMQINLISTASNGQTYYYSVNSVIKNDTISLYIGSNIPLGAYKVSISVIVPTLQNSVLSTYNINVTNTNCQTPKAFIIGQDYPCQSSYLQAYPQGVGYSYQWYKNNILISTSSTSSIYNADVSGSYKVVVSNVNLNFSSVSRNFEKTGLVSPINYSLTSTGSFCTPSGSSVLTSNNVNPNFTYQWYFAPSNFNHQPISGAISNSLTVNNPGVYYAIIKDGSCEFKSNNFYSCPILVNFPSQKACIGSNVIVPFINNSSSTSYSLQLLDATSNAIINGNIATAVNQNPFNFNLPTTVLPGTYKFRIVSFNPIYSSPISSEILTVSASAAPNAPILTSTVSTFTTPQSVTFSASGCNGLVEWTRINYSNITGNRVGFFINQNTTLKAVCRDISGCVSPSASITVAYNCTDPLEPNDNLANASKIITNSYTSPILCLESNLNEDWFSWVYNGAAYFIRVSLYGNASNYQLKLLLNNGNIEIETLPVNGGSSFGHQLYLFNSFGNAIFSSSTLTNGYQKIIYALPNPCSYIINLVPTLFDIGPGITSIPKASFINANNNISNTAIVNYRGQNAITLNPGFETLLNASGTFKAQIKGCGDNTD
jgi:large repetitive protein